MKLYLSLTRQLDNNILIVLRHSTANTDFNEGITIKHVIESDKLREKLILLLEHIQGDLKNNNLKVNITFKGEPQFNYLISDLFWISLIEPSFVYKKRHQIITFVSKKVNLTIINFNIVEYFNRF